MPQIIGKARTVVSIDGLQIDELAGNVATSDDALSIAHVTITKPTSEPWLTLDYDEWICVRRGQVDLLFVKEDGTEATLTVREGETCFVGRGERFRPTFPVAPTEYVPVCRPAFRPERCVREEDEATNDVTAKLRALHGGESVASSESREAGAADDAKDVLYHMCVSISKLKAAGWWAGNTTLVKFEDVQVPAENLIGMEGMGFPVMATAMNGERLIGCAGAVRAARLCLSEAISFARERTTFGQKLSNSQVIRHKFAQMARRIEAAQGTLDSLAYTMKCGAGPGDIGGTMALAKVECSNAHEYCAREASQVLGGAAFLRQGKGQLVERLSREVRVNVVGGGSEEIMLDLAMRMSKI